MPADSSGRFHLNPQRAAASDRMSKADTAKDTKGAEEKTSTASTTLHDHGDGTFHTEGPSGKTEHPAIGHALMHMASQHSGGSHTTTHDDGMGEPQTYSVDDSGEVKEGGPEDGDDAQQDTSQDPDTPHHGLSGI